MPYLMFFSRTECVHLYKGDQIALSLQMHFITLRLCKMDMYYNMDIGNTGHLVEAAKKRKQCVDNFYLT
jgi:hypothetical protein